MNKINIDSKIKLSKLLNHLYREQIRIYLGDFSETLGCLLYAVVHIGRFLKLYLIQTLFLFIITSTNLHLHNNKINQLYICKLDSNFQTIVIKHKIYPKEFWQKNY